MRRLLALPLLLLLAGAAREMHTVEVVQVPVYVVRDGASVAGLTRDNFELYVNGKPQRIDYFDVYDFGATPSKPAAAATAAAAPEPPPDIRQRRLYVLVFDLAFSSPRALSRARAAAYEYVARAGPSDVFSIGVFSAVKGLQLIVPFTRDRDVVRLAIRDLKPLALEDPLHLALGPVERAELFTPAALDETAQVQQLIDDSAAHELALAPIRQRISDQIADLADFADRLAPIEGNRHVVLLTSGFNMQNVHGGAPPNHIEHPVSFGPNAQMDRTPNPGVGRIGMSEPIITAGVGDMNRRFNRAGVFLDCIDVEGLRLAFGSYAQSEALTMLARGTGGQVILNRNDLGEAMQTLADRQRIVYMLGFHAADTGKALNKMRVKLRGVGGRLDDVAVPARELIALGKDAEVLMYVYSGHNVVAFKDKGIRVDAARADDAKPVHVVETFDELPPGHYEAKVLLRVDGTDALGFARAPMTVE